MYARRSASAAILVPTPLREPAEAIMIFSLAPLRRLLTPQRLGLGLGACLALGASPSFAQSLDYSVARIDLIQTIPNVTLVADKPMFVRAHVVFSGTQPSGTTIDGILRVFVDGVEASYSPVYSDNGPLTPPENIRLGMENDTLNFIFQPPATGDLVVSVEVNPPGAGQAIEVDYSNNLSTKASQTVVRTRVPKIIYVPIDYRPNGGGASLPNLDLIEPGAGDNFIQGIYPTADFLYRPSDAPSKLWTTSLSSTGSALLSSLLTDLNMSVPKADFIYGWVPGSLPYNGQANGVPGKAGMGNTQTIRHQRTFAHELGHLLGRNHINNIIGVNGVDVERHLNITESLPRMKPGSLFDVMVAGLLTNQAWVYDVNYEFYITRPAFTSESASITDSEEEHLLLAGVWEREVGSLELLDSVAFRGAVPSEQVPLLGADLIVRVDRGALGSESFGYRINPTTDNCAQEATASSKDSDSVDGAGASAPFSVVLPTHVTPGSVQRVELLNGADQTRLLDLQRSLNAPQVQLSPARRSAADGDLMHLDWNVQDADGDAVLHYLRFSPDGHQRVNLGTAMQVEQFQIDMTQLPEIEPGLAYFELLSSDGLHTSRLRIPASMGETQQRDGAVNAPRTEVLTPDSGLSFPKAATVILHSSGWDLEDKAIGGASLSWSSDLDGVIGSGRLLSVADLSVGTHVLTVTATDSSGMTGSDSTTITITDRPLPFLAAVADRNAGSNPASYAAEAPVLGSVWNASLDLTSTGHSSGQVVIFSAAASLTLGQGQVLLVGGSRLASLPMMSGSVLNFSANIPNNMALLGTTFYTQGVHLFGVQPFALSNAQDLTVGF